MVASRIAVDTAIRTINAATELGINPPNQNNFLFQKQDYAWENTRAEIRGGNGDTRTCSIVATTVSAFRSI